MAKACSICGEVKSSDQFPKGRRQCKPCRAQVVKVQNASYHAANRERLCADMRERHAANRAARQAAQAVYRDANREQIRAQQRGYAAAHPDKRWAARLARWGLTIADYEAMLDAQGGRCAICQSDDSGVPGRRFHVDHDHACCPAGRSCGMCVRGLLCQGCNTALGGFRDDPALLARAIGYLNGVRAHG